MNFAEIEQRLSQENFEPIGRITTASNVAILMQSEIKDGTIRAIFKPENGIRPLWDFPKNDLIERELSSYLLSKASNLSFIPPSVLREIKPFGKGLLQLWIEDAEVSAVQIFEAGQITSDFSKVFPAIDSTGNEVEIASLNNNWIDDLTIFDAVINNSDRKGSHILTDELGRMWAIDHGVCWHEDLKLRTVLWAKAGIALSTEALQLLTKIELSLGELESDLAELISKREIEAANKRIEDLRREGKFPIPNPNWPAVPWPVF